MDKEAPSSSLCHSQLLGGLEGQCGAAERPKHGQGRAGLKSFLWRVGCMHLSMLWAIFKI